MKRKLIWFYVMIALAAFSCFCLGRALADTINVTVKGPKNTVVSPVTVTPAPFITNINCNPGSVIEGDPVTCFVVIDRAAGPGGLTLQILNVPGVTSFSVAAGADTGSFSFVASLPTSPIASSPFPSSMRPMVIPFRRESALRMFWYWTE